MTFTTETPEKAGTYVAVDMGGVDAKNIYEVDILPTSGNYSVYRFQNNKLLKPVPLRKHDSINAGTKVTNELSVVVKGSKGSITINGKKVGDFTGKPPEGGSLVGVNFGTYDDDGGPLTITVVDGAAGDDDRGRVTGRGRVHTEHDAVRVDVGRAGTFPGGELDDRVGWPRRGDTQILAGEQLLVELVGLSWPPPTGVVL